LAFRDGVGGRSNSFGFEADAAVATVVWILAAWCSPGGADGTWASGNVGEAAGWPITRVATRWIRTACLTRPFAHFELRNEKLKSLQEPRADGWPAAPGSIAEVLRAANAVSIADSGVRPGDAPGDVNSFS
jgi:hypothetical protein